MSESLRTTLIRTVHTLNAASSNPARFVEEIQRANGWMNSINRDALRQHDPATGRIVDLFDELSEALDNGADDIGGSRSEKAILVDLVSAAS